MEVNKKAIWKVTNEVVTVIDILESHNEAMFVMEDGERDHTDLKNLIFID